jgi:hypothetical protein
MGPGSAVHGEGALHRVPDTAQAEAQIKTGPEAPFKCHRKAGPALLDLGFAELDMLARDRIVLLLHKLVGHRARILLGDVVEAGIRRGNELDLDGDRLGHLQILDVWNRRRPIGGALFAGQPSLDRSKVKDFGSQIDPGFGRLTLKEAVCG